VELITLSAEDFYKLDAAQGRVSSMRLNAIEMAARVKQQVADAEQRRNAVIAAMAETYGFDPTGVYDLDETRLALVPVEA
jgi:hypothetical protein